MTDDQAADEVMGELLSVAEALTENAKVTVRHEFNEWLVAVGPSADRPASHLGALEEAFNGGWRAALGWYIGLGPARQLADAIEEARQLGREEARGAIVAADTPQLPSCSVCGSSQWTLQLGGREQGLYCDYCGHRQPA